jgi:hypothetical protein
VRGARRERRVRRFLLVGAAVLAVLGLLAFGADRAVAAVVASTISDRVTAELPGLTAADTRIEGVPVLTQVAHGSLDHVVVRLTGVPTAGGLTLESVGVDLYDVSTSAPRTAGSVDAVAHVTTAALQAEVGDRYVLRPDGDGLVVSLAGGLPVLARLKPVVENGTLRLALVSVTVLGIEVSASRVPQALIDRVTALAGSVGTLPLGLTPTAVTVTPTGVDVTAHGTRVALEGR